MSNVQSTVTAYSRIQKHGTTLPLHSIAQVESVHIHTAIIARSTESESAHLSVLMPTTRVKEPSWSNPNNPKVYMWSPYRLNDHVTLPFPSYDSLGESSALWLITSYALSDVTKVGIGWYQYTKQARYFVGMNSVWCKRQNQHLVHSISPHLHLEHTLCCAMQLKQGEYRGVQTTFRTLIVFVWC